MLKVSSSLPLLLRRCWLAMKAGVIGCCWRYVAAAVATLPLMSATSLRLRPVTTLSLLKARLVSRRRRHTVAELDYVMLAGRAKNAGMLLLALAAKTTRERSCPTKGRNPQKVNRKNPVNQALLQASKPGDPLPAQVRVTKPQAVWKGRVATNQGVKEGA